MPNITVENVDAVFSYRKPGGHEPALIRTSHRLAARMILECCPPGRERSLALTNLQQSNFWANAAVALKEVIDPATDSDEVR